MVNREIEHLLSFVNTQKELLKTLTRLPAPYIDGYSGCLLDMEDALLQMRGEWEAAVKAADLESLESL